ncbi:MAG: glycosyltransferase family 4 protein [Calditrichia bacterium]
MSEVSQPPCNVIVMGNFPWPHGMAGTKRIQHIVNSLHGREIPVSLLLLRQGGVKSVAKPDGIYNGVEYQTTGHDIRPDFRGLLQTPAYLKKGMTFLKSRLNQDLSNILYYYGGPTVENLPFLLYAKRLGFKIVFDIVEELEDASERRHLLGRIKVKSLGWLDTHLGRLADGLVVISHYLMDRYRKMLGDAFPILLLPIAAQIRKKKQKESFGDPIKIVYSGSFNNKDGVGNLIDAFKHKREAIPEAQLYLTGKGQNADTYRQKVEGEKQINFIGYLDDDAFYRFLDEADILCMTRVGSDFANAGFPFKLGEYLATGNPVIASQVGDVSRYLKNGEDALLVEPDDVPAIAEALEYAVRNQTDVLDMGRSGREKCRKFFDPATHVDKLVTFLRDITG